MRNLIFSSSAANETPDALDIPMRAPAQAAPQPPPCLGRLPLATCCRTPTHNARRERARERENKCHPINLHKN